MNMTTARLTYFRREGEWYIFRITAEGEDFAKAIEALKRAVPLIHRRYDPETKTWSVATQYGPELAKIFANGRQCIRLVELQLRLF